VIPAVRRAMCEPSRIDQIATNAATSHCRGLGAAPAIAIARWRPPVSPSENVRWYRPAGIAGALLHQPRAGHQDRQRQRDRQQTFQVKTRPRRYQRIMQMPVKSGDINDL